jgi:PTS system mannitol-specific IIC component
MAPRGGAGPVLLGILAGAVCSFAIASLLVRGVGAGDTTDQFANAQARTRARKPVASGAGAEIIFACDAGMGSSVLGAAVLQRKLQEAGLDVAVTHRAVAELPASAGIVVVHTSLAARVRRQAPEAAVYAVDEFIHSPVYDRLVEDVRRSVHA